MLVGKGAAFSNVEVCESGWLHVLFSRCFSSLGGDGDGDGDGDGEGCVIQLSSGSDGAVDRGRVDAGRLVPIVVMVLVEYIEEDLVGERFMVG